MNWWALGLAVVLCVAMAVAEGLLSGKDLQRWIVSLKLPRLYAPLWVWVIVAFLTYAIQGTIAYRLIDIGPSIAGAASIVLLIAVMCANVAYNVVLDRTRLPRKAFTGLIWFLPLLASLQIALVFADGIAAMANLIYVVWVVAYDLPVMRLLWKLNS